MQSYALTKISLGFLAIAAYPAGATTATCIQVVERALSPVTRVRNAEWVPDTKNDADVIKGMMNNSNGWLVSRFSQKYDTRLHATATARPNARGEIPMIDPESKGVYLFFHGSGTERASGRNYIRKMNQMAQRGYAAVGMDMPFHGDGPVDPKFYDADNFMKWLADMVDEVRIPGKPVYMAGHSFGPDVIAEFARRYPDKVNGILMASPAAFDDVTRVWYDAHTEKMNFGTATKENRAGAEWGAAMSNMFKWARPSSTKTDPTLKNNKLKIRAISGDHEEYLPAPIRQNGQYEEVAGPNTYDICKELRVFFRNITCTVEKGVGHYIFEHTDANGVNAIERELFALDGKTPAEFPAMEKAFKEKMDARPSYEKLAQRYNQEPLFRVWLQEKYGWGRVRNWVVHKNERATDNLLFEFDKRWLPERYKEIDSKIKNTQVTHPQFYAAHKTEIDKLGKSLDTNREVYSQYAQLISGAGTN